MEKSEEIARVIFAATHPGLDPEETRSYHTPVKGQSEMHGEFFDHAWQQYLPAAMAVFNHSK